MKKRLFIAFSLLLSMGAMAQTKDYYKENKHEVRLSVGSVNDNYYHYEGYYGYYGGYYGNSLTQSDYEQAGYCVGPKKTSGAYSLSYFYHAPWANGRFSVGGSLAFSSFKADYKIRLTEQNAGNSKEYNIALSPSIRYAWVAKSNFQFYSGMGVSFFYNNYKQTLHTRSIDHQNSDNSLETSFMITPIGFSIGRNIFAFGELNLGGRAGELVAGIGYRF